MKRITLVLIFFLASCGGGGGSSGSNGQTSTITYSGPTSQTTIDSTNAKTLATDSYDGGSLGGGFVSKPGNEENQSSLYSLLYYFVNEIEQSINLDIRNKPFGKTVTVSDTVIGSCGGTLTYSLTGDDTTGSLSGTFTASNYCSLGITRNGSLTVSASYNSSTGQISSITFTLDNYSISSPAKSYTITGTLTLASKTLTINITLKNNTTSKTGKIENLFYTVTSGVLYSDISISGRIYHPDHGYIDITTQTTFRIYSGSSYPSSGVLVITGANNKSAKLTVISSTQYNISADLDGDGNYETNIGTYSWGT